MNTEFEGHADSGRVSVRRMVEGERPLGCDLFEGEDENGGKTTSDIEYGFGYCDNDNIRFSYDGVWLELSTDQRGKDGADYSLVIEARLTWEQATRVHDYLGLLLRLAP
jgi:hypothetical protein